MFRKLMQGAALVVALTLASGAALALDQVRLGKAVPNSFAFSAAEIGTDAKIWQSENIELTVSAMPEPIHSSAGSRVMFVKVMTAIERGCASAAGREPDRRVPLVRWRASSSSAMRALRRSM